MYINYFILMLRNVIRSVIFGAMNVLILSLFEDTIMYWKRSLVGETVSLERIIYC